MRLVIIALLASFGLAGCNSSDKKPDGYITSVARDNWEIAYSPGMPKRPSGKWYFNFPVEKNPDRCSVKKGTCDSVHYVWKSVRGKIRSGGQAVMSFTVSGSPVFNYKNEPTNTCDGPAEVSFILYKSMYGTNNRFWSKKGFELKSGSAKVPLQPAHWINVNGKTPTISAWNSMMNGVKKVGVTFGGGCFKGHGVNASQASRFTMKSYGFK